MKQFFKNIFTALFILSLPLVSLAQSDDDLEFYTKETTYGIVFQSKGWGLSYDVGYKVNRDYRLLDFDLVSLKHPKELRIINGAFENPPPYVFGKLNKAYAFRAGYGIKHYLGLKPNKTDIQIYTHLTVGPVFTLVKPVYLQIIRRDSGSTQSYLTDEQYDPSVHTDQAAIYGESPFGVGLGESKIKPGLFIKAGLGFEWGNYSDEVRTLTLGITIDAFTDRLPIMSKVENKSVFSTFFLSFAFGNKS